MKLEPCTALVPIDLQQGFDEPSWPRRNNPALDANGRRLLKVWRAAEQPVIHVRHDSVEPGSTLRPEQPGNAFRPGFEPQTGEPLVSKSVNCAFLGTDLELRLRRLGAGAVVFFGLSTDMCVSTTVRIASNLGFRTIVAADACACFDLPDESGSVIPAEDVHAAHLATLRAEFAEVATTDEIIAALRATTRWRREIALAQV
jgi:nicotinamidase-related amidase